MLQLITLPIIATCNIIVNQFLDVFSKIHIFFAFLLCFQQVFFFFFCKLILFNGSHKIVTFCNISKYLIHDIEFLTLEIQYIENGAGYPAPFPAIIPATLEAPSSAAALLSCFTTIYSHKISDCICDTTAYMISHFKKRTVNLTYSLPDSWTCTPGRTEPKLPQMQLQQIQYVQSVPYRTQFHQGSCLRRYQN